MVERKTKKAEPEQALVTRPPRKTRVAHKYDPRCLPLVTAMCRLGATDLEVARELGVSLRTIGYWTARNSKFALAMKVGKDEADDRVERSLYHRANGYTYDTKEWYVVSGRLEQKDVRKHIPPDVTACIFWLKNRRPIVWRENGRDESATDSPATLANVETHLVTKIFGIIERHTAGAARQIEDRNSRPPEPGGEVPA